jgi:DNA-binding CsgD family transcriptional regulator
VERNLCLGRLAAYEARYGAARSLYDEAASLVREASAEERAAVELARAAFYAETGDLEAEERAALSVLADHAVSEESRHWAAYYAADAHGRTHCSASAALCRLEALARELGGCASDRPGQEILRWARGTWLVASGRPAEAMSDLQAVLRSHDGPLAPALPLAHAYLGHALFQLGDWDTALCEAAEGLRIAEADGDRRALAPAALAAVVNALRGNWSAAAHHLEFMAGIQRQLGPARHVVFPALAAARLAQARAEPGKILAALAVPAAQPALYALSQLYWRPLHLEALIDTGRLHRAREALDALRDALYPDACASAELARLEARLTAAEGNPARALDLLAEAVIRPYDAATFSLAQLEFDYGRLLLGARRRRSAIRWLLSAHGRYTDLGARPFAARCLRRLTGAGVKIPAGTGGGGDDGRCPVTGAETGAGAGPARTGATGRIALALTPHEQRIARLAAEGMTNQQIAKALFVSAKTVEYHLGNAFAKLGISSRRQLSAELDASD